MSNKLNMEGDDNTLSRSLETTITRDVRKTFLIRAGETLMDVAMTGGSLKSHEDRACRTAERGKKVT